MFRPVHRLLFASFLIACHAAATLGGPCLHELSGLSHPFTSGAQTDRHGDPLKSSSDSSDNCVLCQFMAQGQLTETPVCERSAPLLSEFVAPEAPISRPSSHALPSSPRAPPASSTSPA